MPSRWARDLVLGARMSVVGGPSGIVRAALTAVGVGLGVAVLFVAVSVPSVIDSQHQRGAAREDLIFGPRIDKGDNTILVGWAVTGYRGQPIRVRLLQSAGPQAPVPPGLDRLPRPGEIVVSPALADLLDSPEGELLRPRLDYPIAGTIGDEGLIGPSELAYYLGSDALAADQDRVFRRDGGYFSGVVTTLSAVPATIHQNVVLRSDLTVDETVSDAADHVRNTVAAIDPMASVDVLQSRTEVGRFAEIRRGLFVGAILTLLLVGASLLVTLLDQLRDRRRLLAALVAFGTRRTTLAWSVLWQVAIPVTLGLVVAGTSGVTLGAVLLRIVNEPLQTDWAIIAAVSGVAAVVVLLVTALSTPVLWRLMRADGLRTE
jgi:hypothetical protein